MKIVYLLSAPCVLALAAFAVAGTPVNRAPARTAYTADPHEATEKTRRAGAKLFNRECADCHGSNAEGRGKALPLATPEVRDAAPGTLFWVLTNGSLRKGMPSFAHLPEAQRWQIIDYLKSLR